MKTLILYILKKALYSVSILWGVMTLIFILFNVIPGDPARMALGQRSDSASLVAVRADLGLDKPVTMQYVKYLNDLSPVSVFNCKDQSSYFFYDTTVYKHSAKLIAIGESKGVVLKAPYMRRSYQNKRFVSDMISEALVPTFVLAFISIVLATIIGIGLGILSALKKDTWVDKVSIVVSALGMSLPSYFAAILFAWFFAYLLGNVTGLDLTGSLYVIDDMGEGRHLALKNIILPALTLSIRPLSVFTQLTRNSMLDTLSQDYIRTARAKGLSQYSVVWNHALKNALNPVVSSISGWFASMMAGVIFIEYIFAWKGLGYVLVNALQNFDVPVVMGTVVVISVIFIVVNILTDIVYSILDPRISLK